MNKSLIKIVKRGAEIVVAIPDEPKAADSSVKAARRTKREIVKIITGWINEQRAQNQLAEIVARRELCGKTL